jgi:tRNA(Ile)-lysidine synthetase-like protein
MLAEVPLRVNCYNGSMNISVPKGKYVVAVSGGVDSMVLLDMLAKVPGLELIVAHFEHGIREDSDIDRQNVQTAAARYGLPFAWERGHLGAATSEARAREARYTFLHRVKQEQGADAIITAHHQDDLVETAILNMLRGTHRKGLSSLGSTHDIRRPLLHVTKQELYDYAALHRIAWRTESTNESDRYLRNYIRHHFLRDIDELSRRRLLGHIQKAAETNQVIDGLLAANIEQHMRGGALERRWFTMLPYDVSCEVMAAWLRAHDIRAFDRGRIQRLVVTAKVDKPGNVRDINAAYLLEVGKTVLQLVPRTISKKQRERV